MNRGTRNVSHGLGASVAAFHPASRCVTPEVADAAEHRRKLEALFGGPAAAPAPAARSLQPVSQTAPQRRMGRGRLSERAMLLNLTREAMRDAIARNDDEAFERGAEKFLTSHELPDDADFLCKMLHHPSDKVLCNVMGHISALLLQKRLIASLPIVELAVSEAGRRAQGSESVRCCVQGLLQQIHKLRSN